MARTVVKKTPYLIAYDHYNFCIFNTETGITTDKWGQPVRVNPVILNSQAQGEKYEGWLSILYAITADSCIEVAHQLFPAWRALAKTGIFLTYGPFHKLPCELLSFARAVMEWRDDIKISQGMHHITDYYLMLVEQFFNKYNENRRYYRENEKLFQKALIYETSEDAAYLYNLIKREGTIEFWGEEDNAFFLHHYCLEKHHRNEPLTEVRNLWNDYSKTLLDVISANPIVSEIMEAEK